MDQRTQQFVWLVATSVCLATRVASACPMAGQRESLAQAELAAKNFGEAQKDYVLVTEACPDDPIAWRNLGRVAGANGDLPAAEAALARANELTHGAPDPELHFLRGEFLFALGRNAEAEREHDQAIRDIGPAPTERNARLWLARIEARRGHLEAADLLFAAIEAAAGPAGDDEVSLTRAETLIRGNQVARARVVLRGVQQRHPSNLRALELLAWIYEIEGDLGAELTVRAQLAGAKPDDPAAHADYGRVLERAGRDAEALAAYERARTIRQDSQTNEAFERLSHQLSPEATVALSGFAEPSANAIRLSAGASARVADALRLGAIGWAETGTRTAVERMTSTTVGVVAFGGARLADQLEMRAGIAYRHGNLPRRDIDTIVHLSRDTLGAEFSAVAKVGEGLVSVQAGYHVQWTDAAVAIVEGGDQTGVELHAGYPVLRDRLVLDGGVLARKLELSSDVDGTVPSASHVGWSLGVDAVVWRNNAQRLIGEVLDERLDRGVYLQDALVAGYRHYEATVDTDPTFYPRVALAPSVSSDAFTATLRKVLFDRRVGIELRGLAGYDRGRDTKVLGAGLSAFVVSWRGGRVVLLSEVATESSGIVIGRRTWTSISYHHDLL